MNFLPESSPLQFVPSTPRIPYGNVSTFLNDISENAVVPEVRSDLENTLTDSPQTLSVPGTPISVLHTPRVSMETRRGFTFIHPSPYPIQGSTCTPMRRHTVNKPLIYKSGKERLQEVPCTPKSCPLKRAGDTKHHTPYKHRQVTASQVTPGRRVHRILSPSKRSPESLPIQLFDGDEIFI